jgi:putative PIN family toxin of toxin-antitoxin system
MSADQPRIRAVFDCMVFLQGAARRESAAGACLLLVELGAIELCLSKEIVAELRDVLARPSVRQKFPVLTDQFVDRFLAALERRAGVISEVPRVFAYERDPKDEPYINLAIAARASYLVSRDTDILDLTDSLTLMDSVCGIMLRSCRYWIPSHFLPKSDSGCNLQAAHKPCRV